MLQTLMGAAVPDSQLEQVGKGGRARGQGGRAGGQGKGAGQGGRAGRQGREGSRAGQGGRAGRTGRAAGGPGGGRLGAGVLGGWRQEGLGAGGVELRGLGQVRLPGKLGRDHQRMDAVFCRTHAALFYRPHGASSLPRYAGGIQHDEVRDGERKGLAWGRQRWESTCRLADWGLLHGCGSLFRSKPKAPELCAPRANLGLWILVQFGLVFTTPTSPALSTQRVRPRRRQQTGHARVQGAAVARRPRKQILHEHVAQEQVKRVMS